MLTLEKLMDSERELATGNGDTYRRIMTDEALFVLPGMVLDAEECARAMDSSPGWDEVVLDDARLLPLEEDCAAVVYSFTGLRGEDRYRAWLSSIYVERDGVPRLVLHQQTPLT
ncbi:DUF4440 domain-containing protein [Georgenia subflava]|uniref:DUF4440 domain-containing protein n=1 Tax=Georgenia subflava TaxID=1622177 RepID=A0A6N7EK85_9MICO|nr:DUF4440 domain-containing protein [Georgenia subflava]MPV36965.1 DUF4440 domain-containing protein [Georgenia subflava]